MVKKFISIILFFPLFLVAYQNQVDSIVIIGNNNTKDHVVFREILHPVNNILDSIILKEDINRLYNLGIFS